MPTPDETGEPVRELAETPGGEVVDGDAGDEDQAEQLAEREATDREPTDAEAPADDGSEQLDGPDPSEGDVV